MRTKWVLSPERQRKKNAGWVIHLKRETISLSFVNGVSHDQYFCLWRIVWKHIDSYVLDKYHIYVFDSASFEYLLLSTDFLIIYGTEYSNKFADNGLYHIIFDSIPHALNVSSSFSSCRNLNFIHLKITKITFILDSRFSGFWTL